VKKIIFLFIKLLLFWMLLFAMQHTVFLIYNHHEIKNAGFGQIMLSYFYALRMDLSASAYLMSLPSLMFIVAIFIKKNVGLIRVVHVINIIFIVISLLIAIADTGIYSIWGSKLNSKAIAYALYPKEAIVAVAAVPYWLLIGIVIAEGALAIFIYKKMFKPELKENINILYKIIYIPVLFFLLFMFIRGGFQQYPISKRNVFFSKVSVLNYAALNGPWNFIDIVIHPDIKENPYKYYSNEEAKAIVQQMDTVVADSTEMILTVARPNIVLIILESVSAECLVTLGGTEKIMPGLDSLAKKGLLFSNFYANGFRTEQGIISLLSAFPAQPQTSIMRKFGKFDKLPNLASMLGDSGYSENYYYSGDLHFANMDTYAKTSGFTHILDKDNYNWKRFTDWGAYDKELFECHLKESDKDPLPFFSLIMTATNHEPFDADVEKVFNNNSSADGYKNSAYYTDKCLMEYLRKVKSKSWYKNTLFVIVSDHAHSFPLGRGANEPERHRIPLLLYGNVIKPEYIGKINARIGSQIDLPAMILSQLNFPYKQFERSKNLFNKYSPEFGYYTFDNGFGIITPKQLVVYDHDLGQVVYTKNKLPGNEDEKILKQGKAYLQLMFDEYIHFND
jgi:phosphoglycerol transferase MdoB-like AlkP superfamily enzyme